MTIYYRIIEAPFPSKIVVGLTSYMNMNSSESDAMYDASLAAKAAEIYFATVVDFDTVGCRPDS